MKKITCLSNKKLVFPSLDFTIEPGEIKRVSDEVFSVLIGNSCIKEVQQEERTVEPLKVILNKTNGKKSQEKSRKKESSNKNIPMEEKHSNEDSTIL